MKITLLKKEGRKEVINRDESTQTGRRTDYHTNRGRY